jgi:hypothetical protein
VIWVGDPGILLGIHISARGEDFGVTSQPDHKLTSFHGYPHVDATEQWRMINMSRKIGKMAALIVLGMLLSMGFASVLPASAGPPINPNLFEIPPPETYQASANPFGPANEVHVAMNPVDEDNLLVVAKDYSLGSYDDCAPSSGGYHVGSASYVTKDAGLTWTRSRVPAPYPVDGSDTSPLPYKCGSDPVAMFGDDGTAYYIVLNYDYLGPNSGRRSAIGVARSFDGGETWPESEVRVVHTSGGDDKEWGAVDSEGRVHIVWTELTTDTIWYRRSNTAFDFPEPAIAIDSSGYGNPAVQIDTGPSDMVYVFWRDGSDIKFRRSNNGGDTFSGTDTAFTVNPYGYLGTPRFPFMPALVVDDKAASSHNGRIYVTWPDTGGLGESNVFLRYSDNEGADWSAPIQVDENDDPNLRSVMPAISVSWNGRVDVAWMQEGPAVNVFQAYAARSSNGGDSWWQQGVVSGQSVDSAFSYHQGNTSFIGDYIGIASTKCRIWVAHSETHLVDLWTQETDAFLTKVPTCPLIDLVIAEMSVIIPEIKEITDPPIGPDPCPYMDCPLNRGQGRSLITKLEVALKKLDQLNVRGAAGVLKSFTNEVKAMMKASILPGDIGQEWHGSAHEVMRILGR